MYFFFPWISLVAVLDMFSDLHIPVNVVWYLVYNEYSTWHITSDRWTKKNLVLKVYCSPSLNELLHNSVMPLLARNKERKKAILHVHGVCVVVVCDVCCMWKCGCVYIYLWNNSSVVHRWCVCMCGCVVVACTITFVCISTSAFRTYVYMYQ